MMEVEPTTKGKAGASKSGKGAKGMKGNTVSSGELPSTDNSEQVSSTTGKRRSLAVEEKYQKMTQREHIIKRPDTYSKWYLVLVSFSSWIGREVNTGNVGV